ncbi:glycoside hydrolase family 20 zincin-like fold domain-containing protein [Lachnoclostridium phytofermentans]|uniref:beta-N-acetylhexosaminidase n=1 Tax=Lachnoclostridium phytofermentans (strain ATCC 700394 / DSM 18823 / ISDg) TaxID=357809 RepID=A9KIZ5_LACP7|nr:glycoside hydrolase family 20 zincin-like fold domain-containing protein [Lachnoclostridium phytofermentans]ABX40994.1 Glycoside hydrolase, family 20, catalytic core [Lachnoclostridium phytofermentans ISDg]
MYILPVPQQWEEKEGLFLLDYHCSVIVDATVTEHIYDYTKLLQKDLKKQLGYAPAITRGESSTGDILLVHNTSLLEEEYHLNICTEGIHLVFGSEKGLLYGIQTLRQMVSQVGALLPCCEIKDYPAISNRGYYFDVTRGRIPTMESLKALADKLSYYKMNQLQLYIEHSYLFKNQSEVWRDDTPLTAQDIMELDAYCRRLNIELVPSVSTFGHLYKVLNTKTYGVYCEAPELAKEEFSFNDRMHHHTLDVSNKGSIEFAKKQIEEFLPLFTSEHFNICADETFDLGKGKSRELAENKGIHRLYLDFVKELCEFVIEKGKRPMFWGDVIAGFPETIRELPKDVICLNWGYAAEQRENETKALFDAGAVQYVCPGVGGWNQFINLIESSYHNITRMCSYAHKYQALGVLNTDWGDFGHINHPEFSTTGLIYGAAFSWNRNQLGFSDINRQISCIEYGDSSERFVDRIARVATTSVFNWWHIVMYKEYGNTNFATEETIARVSVANEVLQKLKRELYEGIVFMKPEKRDLIKAYLVAVTGIELFNNIAATIAHEKYGVNGEVKKELAKELEYWFYDYKDIWRTVSRESELYRLQEVIIWYGDLLRDMGC